MDDDRKTGAQTPQDDAQHPDTHPAQSPSGRRRRAPSAKQVKAAKSWAIASVGLGVAAVVCVMVHFFISPLNVRIEMRGGYTGLYFGLVPMALGAAAVFTAIKARKLLPQEKDTLAIIGFLSGVISFIFGTIQMVTCTMCVQFNWFNI